MATVFAGITAALVAALSTPSAVSPQVYRARMRPLAAEHSTAVVVRPLSSSAAPGPIQGAPVDWSSQYALECYARSTSTTPDQAADALFQAAYARVMADTTLGGLVHQVQVSEVRWDFDSEADQVGVMTGILTIEHRSTALLIG